MGIDTGKGVEMGDLDVDVDIDVGIIDVGIVEIAFCRWAYLALRGVIAQQ